MAHQGNFLFIWEEMTKNTCPGPKCDRPIYCKGLCVAHYQQRFIGKKLTEINAHGKRKNWRIALKWRIKLAQRRFRNNLAVRKTKGITESVIRKMFVDRFHEMTRTRRKSWPRLSKLIHKALSDGSESPSYHDAVRAMEEDR
jgi:hypothetical protein